ncbi:type II toxin-antitoxin system RelE/ParE family toxin [Reichenbachiella ulvae]|uniref:Type II toxin-antitoxin system RelE/ParE family toxin n=1 Tax=Reichenbachiella ulvae TaxID=2980104 RepID=A0ABT3CY25_9BACT|nr:type II toxin-antitoxin system RelE/ParE family toxin [Reichenbachiella ulvae]MCV9388499.1 type II toxin-antitoxin system RelE/ParE family toxin [Reichenbachiella ulvae]
MSKTVEWTIRAKKSLDYYCSLISEDSPQNARKVRQEIIKATKQLSSNPYMYQIDEYYPDNSGNIRRFFRWSYRVVYHIQTHKVVILEVYHTSRKPSIN